jgi:two-component system phosphate regulon response regulator PhoB
MNKTILVVDDEKAIRDMVRLTLEKEGFNVVEAPDTRIAKTEIADKTPDLILLDWMLPESSGIDFAKTIRKDKVLQHVPIIMLTAKAEEENRVKGFACGVDDYVVKPFSPRELVARIRAICRRGMIEQPDDIIEMGELRMNTVTHEVNIAGQEIRLNPIEYRLLHFFLTHKDRVYSREQLLHYIWSSNTDVDDRTVDVHILRLRRSISVNDHDKLIQTVHGVGYKLNSRAWQNTEQTKA